MLGVPALHSHALFLLLLQFALLMGVARLLAEGAKRIGQPPIIGELLAGIVLGPSLFGAISPGAFHAIFPPDPAQVHLLESVAWLGMVLLLLLTGHETDIRLLRNLGRNALGASLFGIAVPFILGFCLGVFPRFTPDAYLAAPDRRILFSCFLATAMSISAMPVIARILMDLELTKRNIGVIILSAGVVDDTVGWLILSIIAGLAGSTGDVLWQFLQTLTLTAVFLLACAFVVYPLMRGTFRLIDDRSRTTNTDMVAIVAFTFLLAAITEKIGIHAVFGAFIAGCLLRQVPRLRAETIHKLESVVLSIFAPIFFGVVGLKVDLHAVGAPKMFLVVLLVATAGKMIGCLIGGRVGKMTLTESLAVGIAMNARGAMELVVALVGLSLGILNTAMYGIIVMIAIGTSFMAPIGLRLIMPYVKMTPDESARFASAAERGLFDRTRLKTLIPTAGGPNALMAGHIASWLVRGGDATLTLLYVQTAAGNIWRRMTRMFRHDIGGQNLQKQLDALKDYADEHQARLEVRRATDPNPVQYICKEAARGFDLIMLGAGHRNTLRSPFNAGIVEYAPCHVAIVHGSAEVAQHRRILVATNGSFFSRAALELAILYAEQLDATLTVLYTFDDPEHDEGMGGKSSLEEGFRRMMATTILSNLSPLLTKTTAKVSVLVRQSRQPTLPVLVEASTELYDILFVGAENRQIMHRLSVGYDVERLVAEVPCSVLVVVPKIGMTKPVDA